MLAAGVLVWSSVNVAIDFQTGLERIEDTDEDRFSSRLRDGGIVPVKQGVEKVSTTSAQKGYN